MVSTATLLSGSYKEIQEINIASIYLPIIILLFGVWLQLDIIFRVAQTIDFSTSYDYWIVGIEICYFLILFISFFLSANRSRLSALPEENTLLFKCGNHGTLDSPCIVQL